MRMCFVEARDRLTALRRDGLHVKARDFLKLGLIVMPPALLLSLAGLLLAGG